MSSNIVIAEKMFSPRRPNVDKGDADESYAFQVSNSPSIYRDMANAKVGLRGRKAAASRLPMVNKRNLFSLSWNVENNDVQLDNKTHHSAELRLAFFDTLADSFLSGRWFSEAAICYAHALAIIGKELVRKEVFRLDWSLFNTINADITAEEGVLVIGNETVSDTSEYSMVDFMIQFDRTLQMLTLSERFEAIGPLCRLVIPIYEEMSDFERLSDLYADLQQANSRAAQLKMNGKRHFGSYFRVVFYGVAHFGKEHKSEWVYRETGITSLAEACDRITKSLRKALGDDSVELLPPNGDESRLKPSVAYVLVTYLEPCLALRIGGVRQPLSKRIAAKSGTFAYGFLRDAENGNEFQLIESASDPMSYQFHTNVRAFVYKERVADPIARPDASEPSRNGVKRTIVIVGKCFPCTKTRQRVIGRVEFVQTPIEVACECLLSKAAQIRRIIDAAGVGPGGAYEEVAQAVRSKKLDLTQLQLLLQGSVSPMVNAGVLSYAETFTAPEEKARYEPKHLSHLVSAFKILIAELYNALNINEIAIGNKRNDYQIMLRQSFHKMCDKLWGFFGGESFLSAAKKATDSRKKITSNQSFQIKRDPDPNDEESKRPVGAGDSDSRQSFNHLFQHSAVPRRKSGSLLKFY